MALLFSIEIAGDETENQAAQVCLPGDSWQEGENDEKYKNDYPERHRNNEVQEHFQFGSHHDQDSRHGKDSSGGAIRYIEMEESRE